MQVLDQRLLPTQEVWLPVERIEQMHEYILQLAVRGAPLIGCAAALALAVHVVKAWPKYVPLPRNIIQKNISILKTN